MGPEKAKPSFAPPPAAEFRTTHWSVVLAARDEDSPQALTALETLCHAYWYPLYAYVRRKGYNPDDAGDLTQKFFARLLERKFLRAVQQERGKFRWFLLSAMKRFLANEWHKDHAIKRGGQHVLLSLDETAAEGRYCLELADHVTPEKLFDQSWAMTVLEEAREKLEHEYKESGRGANREVTLQATTDLLATNWTDLLTFTNTAPATNFVDADATNFNRRFYRVVSP